MRLVQGLVFAILTEKNSLFLFNVSSILAKSNREPVIFRASPQQHVRQSVATRDLKNIIK